MLIPAGVRNRRTVAPRAAALLFAGACLLPTACLLPGAAAEPGTPVDLGGTEVEPSYSSKEPTELEAGLWRTELEPRDHQQQQFSYQRETQDSTVHVSVTATAEDSAESLSLRVYAEDGTECGWENNSANSSSPWSVFGVDLAVGPEEFGDRNAACLTSTTLRFEVGSNSTTRDIDATLPMVIKIVEESPLDRGNEDLPEPDLESEPVWTPLSPGDPGDQVTGGRSFADAPLLEPGTHPTTVTEGEERLYRVHLDWGQTVKAQARVPALSPDALAATDDSGTEVGIVVYNTMRRPLDSWFEDTVAQTTVVDQDTSISTGVGPVLYLNRFEDMNAYLPGDYYVSLGAPAADDRDPIDVPVELTVEADGEAAGAPSYVEEQPFLVGDGKRSSVASGNPAPTPESQGWVSARHLTGLGLGLVGVVCLVLGGLRLRRT